VSEAAGSRARTPGKHLARIVVRGAAEHNLRSLDLELPHGALIAFSGVSGSGKSSLAFDTIYAEARRRYLMTLGPGGAGLLSRLRPPRVLSIEGLPPAVAMSQGRAHQSPRSTVGTLTGAHDYLRVLFARLGQASCLACGAPVQAHRFDEVYEAAAGLPEGTRLIVMAPRRLDLDSDREAFLADIDRTGYRRLRFGGEMHLLEDVRADDLETGRIDIVVDRLVVKADTVRRLKGSLQAALEVGAGQVGLLRDSGGKGEVARFSVRPSCSSCGTPFKPVTPALLSFNSSAGACPQCRGLGTTPGFQMERVFAPGRDTLEEALGALWREFGHSELRSKVARYCARANVDVELPLADWCPDAVAGLWEGVGGRGGFGGVRRWLERLGPKATDAERAWLEDRLDDAPCPGCQGTRLGPEARAVRLGDWDIASLSALAADEALEALGQLRFPPTQEEAGNAILSRVSQALQTLQELGLGYVGLHRAADTLSSGEFQRVRLAAALGSGLTQVLYVLDEPTAGLHPRDTTRLLNALRRLRDHGNVLLVVEHDPDLIGGADHVVDLGPGAGTRGGDIVARGAPRDVASTGSPTGKYLVDGARRRERRRRSVGEGGWLHLRRACGHNLKSVDVSIPLGNLVCVTGVSGSGKSSLVHQTLYPLLAVQLQGSQRRPLPHGECEGVELVERVLAVDQKPIGRTPRSNAATYTGILGDFRQLFAQLPEARVRGYRPAHFSFNSPEGGCPECAGSGVAETRQGMFGELQLVCPSCGGGRYNREVLEIRYRQLSIAQVLELSVDAALDEFGAIPDVARRLRLLAELGLGYLHLGQPASSLSGGEAQRVKLAGELGRVQRARTLYILDEPTTGLHLDDIHYLAQLMHRLVEEENTVLLVEHNPDLIAEADHVIDLGPGSGDQGGQVTASGTPEDIAAAPDSSTGQHLHQVLASQN